MTLYVERGNSITEMRPVPQGEGSSTLTLPLQVRDCSLSRIKEVIERVHYSHSVFGITYSWCYEVTDASRTVVGGAIFGCPAAFNVGRKYDGGQHLTELRRFVLEDACPRNSESKTLSYMLRDLKKRGIDRVLSYADPAFGHRGVIYAATGFTQVGLTSPRKHWIWKGKKYPDRNVHQVNFPFHAELRQAIEAGDAVPVKVPSKIVWLKIL